MLPDVIVYESMCGHTLTYAKKLALILNVPLMTIHQAKRKLSKDATILFMSWICEDQLVGYNSLLKFHIVLIVAVGIMPYSEEMKQRLIEENQIYCGLFYLMGGIDKKKLSFRKRIVLRAIRKDLEFKKLDQGLTFEQESALMTIQKNVNYVDLDSLEPIINFFSDDLNFFVS